MKVTYKTSLELSNSELKKLYEWVSPITFKEPHLLPRTPEELARSIFSVYAFKGDKVIGFGFVYPSCKDKKMTRSKWIKWRKMKLVEMGTLYVVKEERDDEITDNLINLRLDYIEGKNYFPVTVTKHKAMVKVLKRWALRIEEVDGVYSEIKSLIRDCYCKTAEQKATCNKCPYDERTVWVYLRFILRKY